MLKHDEPLSNFNFNFNLRRYDKVVDGLGDLSLHQLTSDADDETDEDEDDNSDDEGIRIV
jgi:hypothetical protein